MLASFPPDTADLSELLAIALKLCVMAHMTQFVTQDGRRHKLFLAHAAKIAPAPDTILPRWKTRANAAGLLWVLFVIAAECYAPNGASRITNRQGQITRILNNYARMSYNFGPTLLSWLETFAPRTYNTILDADRESAARFSVLNDFASEQAASNSRVDSPSSLACFQ